MKINGKPCQTLVDAKACRGVPGKTGKRQLKVRILTTVCSPKSLPIIPDKERGEKKPFAPSLEMPLESMCCHKIIISIFWTIMFIMV